MIIMGIVCSFGCASTRSTKSDNITFVEQYQKMPGNSLYTPWPGQRHTDVTEDFSISLPPGCFLIKEEDGYQVFVVETTAELPWIMVPTNSNHALAVYSRSDNGEAVQTVYNNPAHFMTNVRDGKMFPMSGRWSCSEVIGAFPKLKQ